jgi:hypothetical protein
MISFHLSRAKKRYALRAPKSGAPRRWELIKRWKGAICSNELRWNIERNTKTYLAKVVVRSVVRTTQWRWRSASPSPIFPKWTDESWKTRWAKSYISVSHTRKARVWFRSEERFERTESMYDRLSMRDSAVRMNIKNVEVQLTITASVAANLTIIGLQAVMIISYA